MPFAAYVITNGLKTASIAKCEAKGQDGSYLQPGLVGMFKTPLCAAAGDENSPTTHWISSGHMSQAEIDYLNAQLPPAFDYFDGTTTITDEQGQRIIAEDAHAFIKRKGLKLKPSDIT